MLALRLQHVSSWFFGFLVASPCLWGKLQNLSFLRVAKLVAILSWVAGVPLCDIHVNSCFVWQAHASFSEFELHFSWQAWHFGDLHRHFAWQAQHLRRVVLRALHSTLRTLRSTLHPLHFTLYIPHFALYTLHSTLYTPHSTLHTPHSTLCTPHTALYTLHFTLDTSHSTLHTLAHCVLTSIRDPAFVSVNITYNIT